MDKYLRPGLGGSVAAVGGAALLGTTMLTASVAAQTAEELKAQIDKLQAQVDQLSQQQTAAAPVQAVVGGDKPRTYKLPGTDTSLQVGGYVKGDLIYDVKSENGDSFAVSAIPLEGSEPADEREGHVRFHARQSRVWFKTWTPSDLGEVRTHIEGDFEGGSTGDSDPSDREFDETFSNSSLFRLRHAYGTLGGLLIGQTWTNFMGLHGYPETIDFFGPTGMPFLRQAQIRYTFTPSPGLAVSVSAENPETDGRIAGTGAAIDESRGGIAFDEYPDFTARIKYSGEMVTLSAGAVARWLTVDNGLGGAAEIDDEEFGWGLRASASADLVGGRMNVVANVHGGDGIGRYMLTSGRALVVNGDDLDTVTQWGTTVGAGWKWTDYLRSSVGWGHVEIDDDDLAVATQPVQQDTIHLNLIWAPVPRVWIGIEGIYGRIEVDNNPGGDDDNDQFRLQIGSRFSF